MIFLLIALLHLFAIGLGYESLRTYTKPLLLPILAITVYSKTAPGRDRNIFICALLFSFLGDVLLMFEHVHPLFFIFGLVSFLLAHILYIVFFLGIGKQHNKKFAVQPVILLLVLAYGLSLLLFLWPSLGDLKIPVAVYAFVICSMLLGSIAVQKMLDKTTGMYFLAGALLFVSSDSILAINKFYQAFSIGPVLIMLTYCAAQYALSKGFIRFKA